MKYLFLALIAGLTMYLFASVPSAEADCKATSTNTSCRNVQTAPASGTPLAPAAFQSGCKLMESGDIFCQEPNGSWQKANCQREANGQAMCLAVDGTWQERSLLNAGSDGYSGTGLISARMPVGSTTVVVVPPQRTEAIVVYPPYGYGTQCHVLGVAYQTRKTRLGFLTGGCQ